MSGSHVSEKQMIISNKIANSNDRRAFIGGSDARIIMGDDEAALLRLWREKRGEVEPEDLSGNLIVQLGTVTEELNRRWYERNTGHAVNARAAAGLPPRQRWMAATLDGMVERLRGGVRGQIHAALDVLGGSGRRESTWRSCSTICGSRTSRIGGAVDHHRRRQMGGNDHSMPIRSISTCS